MTELYLFICPRRGMRSEVREELRTLSAQVWYRPYYTGDEPEVLWRKGLKYIATIIRAACELQLIEQSGGEMRETYDRLKRKVKIRIRTRCHKVGEEGGWDEAGPSRVFWPCEILDLREVQDEIKVLASGDLLDRDNSEDRKIVQEAIKHAYAIEDRRVDEWISVFNTCVRELGIMLERVMEIHRKHPEERFWFFTTLF
ncbi:MAG: hypothetical protein QXF52_04585 [Thermoproteota archaeon]